MSGRNPGGSGGTGGYANPELVTLMLGGCWGRGGGGGGGTDMVVSAK